MSQGEERQALVSHPVSLLCGYLGISRQGYYRHVDRSLELDVLRSSIVFYAQGLRTSLPKAGIRIFYELCRRKYADKFTVGRDQCYELFRSNGLCLRRRKRPRTTNSNNH